MEQIHYSVLLKESVSAIAIKQDGVYVDGTCGMGGHSEAILKQLGKTGRLISIDQDEFAIEQASLRLKSFKNFTIFKNRFSQIKQVLKDANVDAVDGVLLDIGVSSPQLDVAERGFSFRFEDSELDMRMDKTQELDAKIILNEFSEIEIGTILRDFGEEKFFKKISKYVTIERLRHPITTVKDLKNIIDRCIPAKLRFKENPYQRTFQALRIAVNSELDELKEGIKNAFDCLKSEGRLAVITFHSLEDRIVKQYFKELTSGCDCNMPKCVCGKKEKARYVGGKFITASEEELKENTRSRSAKLRIIEKI